MAAACGAAPAFVVDGVLKEGAVERLGGPLGRDWEPRWLRPRLEESSGMIASEHNSRDGSTLDTGRQPGLITGARSISGIRSMLSLAGHSNRSRYQANQ